MLIYSVTLKVKNPQKKKTEKVNKFSSIKAGENN